MSNQHRIHLPDEVDMGKMEVSMSNAIVRSAHGLTLAERRLITACIAKTRQEKWPAGFWVSSAKADEHRQHWEEWHENGSGPFSVRLSAADYARAYDIQVSTAYTQLQTAADTLLERIIKMPIRSAKGTPGLSKFHWVQKVNYFDREGYIEVMWSFDLAKHIYNIGRERTQYLLEQVSQFQSIYPWRLFELLRAHNDPDNQYAPNIDDFASAMDAPPAYANDFAALRRRIIEVSIAELKEKYGHVIEYTTVNAGRKVVGLKFKYDLFPAQAALPLSVPGEEEE